SLRLRGSTPDGVTYGSRWSRAKRETTGTEYARFPTAAAVAEGIHAAWYLIRDALRGRPSTSHVDRWSRASRATTGYPPCRHPATVPRSVNLCASTVRTPLFLARASRPRRRPLQNLGCP